MGEYEDRYPEAYGQLARAGLARQPSEILLMMAPPPPEPPVIRVQPIPERRAERPAAAPGEGPPVVRPFVRSPRQICDDVYERLRENSFIDATGVTVAVTGSEVTLDGTINSLIAVSLARALASNVAGVSAVQVRLKVQHRLRSYETASTPDSRA